MTRSFTRRLAGAFTLLEVVCAVAILGIALVAIFRLQGSSASVAARVKFETTAPLLANKKMSEIMSAGDPVSDSGDFGKQYPFYRWKAVVEPVEPPESLGETGKRLVKVMLKVVWGDNEQVYDLETLRLLDQ